MEKDIEKVFFNPGDMVTLKHDIPHSPIMYIVKKETSLVRGTSDEGVLQTEEYFKGMRCRWFTKDHLLQEAIFNTKDLIKHG